MICAKRFTHADRRALDKIQASGGFVGIENGEPYLETARDISAYRVNRLYALGYLDISGIALFPECEAQSYRVVDAKA